jgi:hypothetical protein
MSKDFSPYRSHQFIVDQADLRRLIVTCHVHGVDLSDVETGKRALIATVVGEKDRIECFVEEHCQMRVKRPFYGVKFIE